MRLPGRRIGPVGGAAAMVVAALIGGFVAGCTDEPAGPAAAPTGAAPVTSTTAIAGAGVLGNQRRPDESCAADPARLDPEPPDGAPTRSVRHAAGSSNVPADPQRIVVLSGDALDGLCALGLQSRIVAAALPDGSDAQPSYLGAVIHALPAAGSRSTPDLAAVRAARPDLILGSRGLTPESYDALSAIAPTAFTGAPGPGWQDDLRTVGAATGRSGAADELLAGFGQAADRLRTDHDTTHYQASVVRLTDQTLRVYGTDDFPASVLTAAGVDRPSAQRFRDRPYLEIGTTGADATTDFSAAEGDAIYVSFDSAAARERAAEVFDGEAWRRLSATRDHRVFVVNDEVWQTGQGLIAARGILDDLRTIDAPIN